MTKFLKKRFIVRTIKNGSVKINGKIYKPDIDASKFNGKKAVFGLYYIGNQLDDSSIFLWGDLEMKNAITEIEFDRAYKNNIFCEKGMFIWEFWFKQMGYMETSNADRKS